MGRRGFQSLGEVIASVALGQRDASSARRSGGEPGEPKPREVYLDACRRIGSTFVPDGFTYLRSQQACSRDSGRFRHRVAFQSSHNNVAGRRVALWMYATVRCPELGRWRADQPRSLRRDDAVAGGMVHLLEDKAAMLEWELADPQQREHSIGDAIAFIRSVVLPYFAKFEDPAKLLCEIEQRPINAFSIGDELELALCFGGPEQAQRVLTRFIAERPDLHESIRHAVEAVERDGLPAHVPRMHAEVVAWAHLTHALKVDLPGA